MTHPELVDALRRAAKEKAASIREAARADVERHRSQVAEEAAALRARAAEDSATEARDLMRDAKAEAAAEAQGIVLAARSALAGRLYRLARGLLPRYRDDDYAAMFDALAREVPRRAWPRVKVDPSDRELAARRFPDAELVTDEAIVAGLVVEEGDGRVRVDNTLEKRLERAWPQILPGIVNEIVEGSVHRRTTT